MTLTLSIIIFGYLITNLLTDDQLDFLEKILIAFGLGFGIINFLSTIWLVSKPISMNVIYIFSFTLSGFLLVLHKILNKRIIFFDFKSHKETKTTESVLNKVLLVLIFTLFIFLLVDLAIWPPYFWDSIALYDFRGKYFASGKTLQDLADITRPSRIISGKLYDFSYPLFTSIVHAVLYLDGFSNPKWIYLIFSFGFLYIFYKFQRRNNVKKSVSLLLLLSLISQPVVFLVSHLAYTNMPFMYYFVLGVFFLYEWIKNKRVGTLILSSLLIVLSTQVRNLESFYIVVVLFLVILSLIYHKYIFQLLTAASVVFLSGQFWFSRVRLLDLKVTIPTSTEYLSNATLLGLKNFSIERFIEVFKFYFNSLWFYSPFFLLFIVTLSNHFFKRFHLKRTSLDIKYLFFPAFISLLVLYTLIGSYFFSFTNDSWKEISGSLYRVLIPILPLILSYTGFILGMKKIDNGN